MDTMWWKESVVYQIYPRSFMDSSGDGIGDLKGIISKIDYLKELGVDVVWLCPIYESPNEDNGYDISDYKKIMNEYGTMSEFEELLNALHSNGIKLVMDIVLNHTSSEHKWFIESRSSISNPYRDYYFWRQGNKEQEPNNWVSVWGGSAWEYDESGEYYLHLFSKKQPDLNWDNQTLRYEIYKMMNWWIEKGVDGFRLDAINWISKKQPLPDAFKSTKAKYQWGGKYYINGPNLHKYLKEMHKEVFSKHNLMVIGETPGGSIEHAIKFRNELNMIVHFDLMFIDAGKTKWDIVPWKLSDFKRIISKWQLGLEVYSWNCLYLNSHDQPRAVSRFGDDTTYRIQSAKLLATMLHMLKGTPFIYQGEEIGMTNVRFDSIDDYRDVESLNLYNQKVIEENKPPEHILESIYRVGRDNARTPMQWDNSKNSGFTIGKPWININPNYKEVNVKNELSNSNSIFHYYKRLIQIRKEFSIVVNGDYHCFLEDDEKIFCYTRTLQTQTLLVILNFSGEYVVFTLSSRIRYSNYRLLICNYDCNKDECIRKIQLKPYESRVYLLT
ncbi:glycoside hydrolase family 13 protein [Clostridium beijerinckii]|uniref:glycoside hydrolase family 13 protein n=1 Tax=Clostridium beijerinckii TaxID=1520 RepID=UPI00047B0144|nr:alpha-glucosidase [Clostridium beijerinckii]